MGQVANASVLVTIGAALSNGFNSAFKQTADKLKTVGSAVAELGNKAAKLDALRTTQAKLASGLDTLTARQVKAGAASGQAAARVVDLKTKIGCGGAGGTAGEESILCRRRGADQDAGRVPDGLRGGYSVRGG